MDTSPQPKGSGTVACTCQALLMITFFLLAGCTKPTATLGPPAPLPRDAAAQPKGTGAGPATATSSPQPAAAASETGDKSVAQEKNIAVIRVYYATDRSRSSQADPSKWFDGRRGALSYGSCEITVPRDTKMARQEAAAGARLEFEESLDSHPVLHRIHPRKYEAYLEQLKTVIAKSAKKSAFVFVHGYDVTFAEAARRTAQLKYDLGFDGAPIFFSWPSKGRADAFSADEADVEWAQPDLKEFLKELAGKTGAGNIYLIAHGMGNRALAKAYIYLISERPELKKVFREVILVAPDVDADLFKRDIAPALAASANHTTLYTSSKDPALKTSNKFQNYPRAGDSGPNLVLFDGIETVDATGVRTGLAGHSYPADHASVISDLYFLIRDGKRPGERAGLTEVNGSGGLYWRFRNRRYP